ncbi:hypothetical protein EGI16_19895 [Chryseobacterium sp. G0240]|uniref:hypothetical protein n=1 Tax=Chryseobacterium sp. G0240 TaxID=2487066 RepID=UPI000F453109|nr:hypothetical protein [Chryseobacterium sp. G0240]ROH98828.1 hypothetical protein EGI16_19895 [Chryseobacterium sp. G0240]
MNKISIGNEVKELSSQMAINSTKEVIQYFPIDRFFIEKNGFIEKIRSVNYLEFLLCNFENVNPTYTVQLFICLPELWEKVNYEDLIKLTENFTNSFSFYSFIEFTYKYLEIDLFDEIIYNKNIEEKFKRDCLSFTFNTLDFLYLEDYEYIEFKENLFGINIEQLRRLQLKFKNDNEFTKAKPKNELYKKLLLIQV